MMTHAIVILGELEVFSQNQSYKFVSHFEHLTDETGGKATVMPVFLDKTQNSHVHQRYECVCNVGDGIGLLHTYIPTSHSPTEQ